MEFEAEDSSSTTDADRAACSSSSTGSGSGSGASSSSSDAGTGTSPDDSCPTLGDSCDYGQSATCYPWICGAPQDFCCYCELPPGNAGVAAADCHWATEVTEEPDLPDDWGFAQSCPD